MKKKDPSPPKKNNNLYFMESLFRQLFFRDIFSECADPRSLVPADSCWRGGGFFRGRHAGKGKCQGLGLFMTQPRVNVRG